MTEDQKLVSKYFEGLAWGDKYVENGICVDAPISGSALIAAAKHLESRTIDEPQGKGKTLLERLEGQSYSIQGHCLSPYRVKGGKVFNSVGTPFAQVTDHLRSWSELLGPIGEPTQSLQGDVDSLIRTVEEIEIACRSWGESTAEQNRNRADHLRLALDAYRQSQQPVAETWLPMEKQPRTVGDLIHGNKVKVGGIEFETCHKCQSWISEKFAGYNDPYSAAHAALEMAIVNGLPFEVESPRKEPVMVTFEAGMKMDRNMRLFPDVPDEFKDLTDKGFRIIDRVEVTLRKVNP